MRADTKRLIRRCLPWLAVLSALAYLATSSQTQPPSGQGKATGQGPPKTSYDQISPVLLGQETFAAMMAKDKADKADVMARQRKLLEERYDLSVRVDPNVKMTRGKPIPVGPATKLPQGQSWDQLAGMSSHD